MGGKWKRPAVAGVRGWMGAHTHGTFTKGTYLRRAGVVDARKDGGLWWCEWVGGSVGWGMSVGCLGKGDGLRTSAAGMVVVGGKERSLWRRVCVGTR